LASRIMFSLTSYPAVSQNRYRGRFQRWLSGAVVLGVLSGAAPSTAVTVENSVESRQTIQSRQTALSVPSSAISLNIGDLLRNAVRYVQVANISDEEEVEIGQQINEMLLEQQYQLYRNPQVNQYVDRLGQYLVEASDRRDVPYTFQVIASDEINAFAIPGGFIYVTTGLLQAADNEAQLASVLAHEIAHVNERHSVQALRRAVLAQGIAETVGLDMNTLVQVGYQLAVSLPRSREFEYEADQVGLNILQDAGYAPIAFVQFFNQLREQAFPPEFLRTHPVTENRIEAIQSLVEPGTAYIGGGLNEEVYESRISPLL